jgi:hypothetical protein
LRDNDKEIAVRLVLFILLFGFMVSSPLVAGTKDSFDGKWRVASKSIAANKEFTITIENGQISGSFEANGIGTDFDVRGTVQPNGQYEIECENDHFGFTGEGQLNGRNGKGETDPPNCGFGRDCTPYWTWTKLD